MHLVCEDGNVWAACGDGVEIWSRGGALLGVIKVLGKSNQETQRAVQANLNNEQVVC